MRVSFYFAVLGIVVALLIPPTYESTTRFRPEATLDPLNMARGLAGLATQFGISIGAAGGDSPQFYASVLESESLRNALLGQQFANPRVVGRADSTILLDLLEIEGDSLSERLYLGRKLLAQTINIDVDRQTGVVAATVGTRYPQLSADVANAMIQLLNDFNLRRRSSNARLLREFIQEQVAQSEHELRLGEDSLRLFLQDNRNFENSPTLRVQSDRLERQLRIKEGVFISLRQQFDQARIQEVNNTPAITVIDGAIPAEEKSSPRRWLIVIGLAFLGLLLGGGSVVVGEHFARATRRGDPAASNLIVQWLTITTWVRDHVGRRVPRRTA